MAIRRSLKVACAFAAVTTACAVLIVARAPVGAASIPEPPCSNGGCFDITHAMAVAHDLAVVVGPRYPASSGDAAAQQYLTTALSGYGLNVQLQTFSVPQGSTANVVASSAPDFDTVMNAGRFILVVAHYDTTKGNLGGNDNASGTGSLVEFARALQAQPAAVPVVFVAYGAEENQPNGNNRVGSKYFLSRMTSTQRANLVAMINLDMIGYGSKVLLRWLSGTPKEATDRLVSLAQSMGITTSVVNFATSDETYFAQAGLNVGSLRGETPSCYDQPCDTYSTIDPSEVERAARLGLAEVRSYDDVDQPPVVTWTSPDEGAQVGQSFTAQVSVTDDNFSGPPPDVNPPTATLYVDGVSQGTKSGSYSWSLSGLAYGSHTLHVEASDGNNPPQSPADGDRHVTVVEGLPVWTRVEQKGTGVAYSGWSWSTFSSSCASGGSYRASRTAGNSVTFVFTGIGVRWISVLNSTLGKAEVFVDGVDRGAFDLYAPTKTCQVVEFEMTGLTAGSHSLRVKVLGTKNASASSAWVVVDAFEYLH
jgi:hypothetical protein